MRHFILKGRELVPVDMMTWARWFEAADRRVGLDYFQSDRYGLICLSTVCLGLRHPDGGFFESMVFREKGTDDFGMPPPDDLVCARVLGRDVPLRHARRSGGRASQARRAPEQCVGLDGCAEGGDVMFDRVRRWWVSRKRDQRAASRDRDVRMLWPMIWKEAGFNPARFIQAATMHTAIDPAWRYSEEWVHTDQNPGRWCARRMDEREATR